MVTEVPGEAGLIVIKNGADTWEPAAIVTLAGIVVMPGLLLLSVTVMPPGPAIGCALTTAL